MSDDKDNGNEGFHGGPVGYGNPPKATLFQPGQSGNPKGRKPKKRDDTYDMVEKIFFGEQQVMTGGKKISMNSMEIIFMRLREQAQKGDTRSIRQIFSLIEKYGLVETKLTIIPPFIPNIDELRKEWAHELEDYDEEEEDL